MTIEIDGHIYYRTLEACKKAGISADRLSSLWLKAGVLQKSYKNRRGWRLFTEEDVREIRAEARKIKVEFVYPGVKNDKS